MPTETTSKQQRMQYGNIWAFSSKMITPTKRANQYVFTPQTSTTTTSIFPSFDQVNVLTKNLDGTERDRIVFIFHVVEGDDLFPDNTWVSEDDFSDDRWSELLDYIVWDI